jgi:hypothetical protein
MKTLVPLTATFAIFALTACGGGSSSDLNLAPGYENIQDSSKPHYTKPPIVKPGYKKVNVIPPSGKQIHPSKKYSKRPIVLKPGI